MGYDFHVTRAADWTETAGSEIGSEEWRSVVESDPELVLDPENGPHAVRWTGHSEPTADAWLDWARGNVFTTNPDRPLFLKMLQIAQALDANVQGDEKELYESAVDYDDSEHVARELGSPEIG